MKKNSCGKCNICCTMFEIDKEFLNWRNTNKAAGETCDKLVNGKCSRYSTRPKPCRDFDCFWLTLVGADVQWRPDKVGFVVRVINEENRDLICLEEVENRSLDLGHLTEQQDLFLKSIFTLRDNQNVLGSKEVFVVVKPFGHTAHYLLKNTI